MKVRLLILGKAKIFVKERILETMIFFNAIRVIFSSSTSYMKRMAFNLISPGKTGASSLKFGKLQKRNIIKETKVQETRNIENKKRSGFSEEFVEKRDAEIRDFIANEINKNDIKILLSNLLKKNSFNIIRFSTKPPFLTLSLPVCKIKKAITLLKKWIGKTIHFISVATIFDYLLWMKKIVFRVLWESTNIMALDSISRDKQDGHSKFRKANDICFLDKNNLDSLMRY
jgi:hypothetical protein